MQNGKIGKGSCATVYKVLWLGKHFAEKHFDGPENKYFQEELSLLVGLSHPNILPLFCYTTCSCYCSLVMDLMDMDLREFMLKRLEDYENLEGRFELLEAVDIMLQVT